MYRNILLVLFLGVVISCSDNESPQSQMGQAVFDVQSRAGGEKQLVRLFLAERMPEHEDGPGHNDEPLHCDPMLRFTVTSNPYTLNRPLFEQWYKFAFLAVPSQSVGEDMGLDMFVPEKPLGVYEQEHRFNKLMIDYTAVLDYQMKSNMRGTEDLAVYRKIIDRWVESEKTLQEKVTLTRITGELVLDMGIPVDQFEQTLTSVTIDIPNVHSRIYIRDGGNDSIYLDETFYKNASNESKCTFSKVLSDEDQVTRQMMRIALLPQELAGAQVTVTFKDATSKTYQLVNDANRTISIKKNTKTTVRFNGVPGKEYEIRYAGFNDDAVVDVDSDEWDGWKPNETGENQGSSREGTYIVNYLPEDAATRSISDGLVANQRISSLTYLLYNSGGELLKRREIPDISTSTTWPLKRETMTWEQREALKDTLEAERNYRVVFVANAVEGTATGWTLAPLASEDDYENVCLQMPAEAFSDGNMFYAFKTTLTNGTAYNRDIPCDCPVVLERVVACTDFWGEQLPDWESDEMKTYLQAFDANWWSGVSTDVSGQLKTELKDFVNALSVYFNNKASDASLTEEQKADYVGWKTGCDNIGNGIETGTYHNTIFSSTEDNLKTTLWTSCLGSTSLKEKWRNWTGATAKLKFSGTSGAARLMLKDWTSRTGAAESVGMLVENTKTEDDGKTYDGFTWVGLGQGGVADANHIESVSFTNASETFTIAADVQTNQVGNTRRWVKYTPISTLACSATRVYEVNYKGLVDLLFGEEDTELKTAVNKALADVASGLSTTLQVNIPDFSGNNITVESKWEKQP